MRFGFYCRFFDFWPRMLSFCFLIILHFCFLFYHLSFVLPILIIDYIHYWFYIWPNSYVHVGSRSACWFVGCWPAEVGNQPHHLPMTIGCVRLCVAWKGHDLFLGFDLVRRFGAWFGNGGGAVAFFKIWSQGFSASKSEAKASVHGPGSCRSAWKTAKQLEPSHSQSADGSSLCLRGNASSPVQYIFFKPNVQ